MVPFKHDGASNMGMGALENARTRYPTDRIQGGSQAAKPEERLSPKSPLARTFIRERPRWKVSAAVSTTNVLAVSLASVIIVYLLLNCFRHLSLGSNVGGSSRILAGNPPNGDQCHGLPGNSNGDGASGGDHDQLRLPWSGVPMESGMQKLMEGLLHMLAEPAAQCARIFPHLRRSDARKLFKLLGSLAALELSGLAFLPPGLQPLRGWVASQYVAAGTAALETGTHVGEGPHSRLIEHIKVLGEPPDKRITAYHWPFAQAMAAQFNLCHFSTYNIVALLNHLISSIPPSNGRIPEPIVLQTLSTLRQLFEVRRWQVLRNFFTRFWMCKRQQEGKDAFLFDVKMLTAALSSRLGTLKEELAALQVALQSAGSTSAAAASFATQHLLGPSQSTPELQEFLAPAPPQAAYDELWDPTGYFGDEDLQLPGAAPPQGAYGGPWSPAAEEGDPASTSTGEDSDILDAAAPQGAHGGPWGPAAEEWDPTGHSDDQGLNLPEGAAPQGAHSGTWYPQAWYGDSASYFSDQPVVFPGAAPPQGAYGGPWDPAGNWDSAGDYGDQHVESPGAAPPQAVHGGPLDLAREHSPTGHSGDEDLQFPGNAAPQGAYGAAWGSPSSFSEQPLEYFPPAPPPQGPTEIWPGHERPDSSGPSGAAVSFGAYGADGGLSHFVPGTGTSWASQWLQRSRQSALQKPASKATASADFGSSVAATSGESQKAEPHGAIDDLQTLQVAESSHPFSGTTDGTGAMAGESGSYDDEDESDGDELLRLLDKAVDWSIGSDEEDQG